MLKIRLQRVGRKHEPTFRVVLTDSKNSAKSGKVHEILGSYDPRKKTEIFKGDRIKEWMSKGAQASGTVYNLLVTHKVIEGKKKNVLPYKKPFKSEKKLAEEKAAADAILAKEAAEKAAKEAAEAEAKAAEEAAAAAEQAASAPEEAAPEATPEAPADQQIAPEGNEEAPSEPAEAPTEEPAA